MLENILRDLLKVRLTEVLKRDNGTDEILSIVNEIIVLKDDIYYNRTLQNIFSEYKKIEEVYNVLDNEIDKGFESNIECILDDFYNILVHVNDGFSLDIDIAQEYNCFPICYLILSISYEDDNISENEDRVDYIFNYVEENNSLKITSIEDINFYGGK